jgi:hypothetical protein
MAITSDVRNKVYQKDDHHSGGCSHDDDECWPVLRGRRGAIYPGTLAAVIQALTDSQGERQIDEAVPSGTPPSP